MHLQIHHIIPESEGGTDSENNLAPFCTECHSLVHGKMSMTKNISAVEIRIARDKIYELAESGQLHGAATLSKSERDEIASSIADRLSEQSNNKVSFSGKTIELLLASVSEQKPIQVIAEPVYEYPSRKLLDTVTVVRCGFQEFHFYKVKPPKLPHEVVELLSLGLIYEKGDVYQPTSKALEFFGIVSVKEEVPGFFIKKIKCQDCSLHFTILTWYEHKHNKSNVHCPKCGQNAGRFYISIQREAGFIFENVPGNATLYQD